MLFLHSAVVCGQVQVSQQTNDSVFGFGMNQFIDTVYNCKTDQIKALSDALLRYSSFDEAQFSSLPYPGVALRYNDTGVHVLQLKNKLNQLGLLHQIKLNNVFDDTTEQSVKKFQQMHNLTPDGVMGKNSYGVLSLSLKYYLETIKTNLSRYAQLPDSLPATRIEINIPEFALRYFHKGKLVTQLEIIVGTYKTKTPELQSTIDYLVFNPCWTVPHSIAVKKILPRLKLDSLFLDKNNMFVCIDGVTQDHRKIDFTGYSAQNFPYKIFQNASSGNALGKVKFMFDNSFSVYLHDTPSKYLFNKDFRTFSNGCIRLNHALELASLMLQNDRNPAQIASKLAPGYPVKVYLSAPVPIFIQYFTARYNPELGMVQFFRDCYQND